MLFGKRKLGSKKPKPVLAGPTVVRAEPSAAVSEPEPLAQRTSVLVERAASDATPAPPAPIAAGATLPEAEVAAVLTIDCAAVARNWRTLASRSAPADCAA